jgi:N-acetyltransferase
MGARCKIMPKRDEFSKPRRVEQVEGQERSGPPHELPMNIDLDLDSGRQGGAVRADSPGTRATLFWEVAKNDVGDIFRWIPYRMQAFEDFERLIDQAFAEQEPGESVVFATVERGSGRAIGSTRFMNIDRINRRVEIGSTWIAPAWQRTAVNTEAKYLMLRHAFEVWNCIRVELKTDALNRKSREAILRIGAKEEGTLRRHLITWTSRVRDTVYFSILDNEVAGRETDTGIKAGNRFLDLQAK